MLLAAGSDQGTVGREGEVAVPCECPGALKQIKGPGSPRRADQSNANRPAEGQTPGKEANSTDHSSASGTKHSTYLSFGFR